MNPITQAPPQPHSEHSVILSKPLTGTMTRICNWCSVPHVIGTKPCLPEFHGQETHGMCDLAANKWQKQLKTQMGTDETQITAEQKPAAISICVSSVKICG
jgi:hypothetical protein